MNKRVFNALRKIASVEKEAGNPLWDLASRAARSVGRGVGRGIGWTIDKGQDLLGIRRAPGAARSAAGAARDAGRYQRIAQDAASYYNPSYWDAVYQLGRKDYPGAGAALDVLYRHGNSAKVHGFDSSLDDFLELAGARPRVENYARQFHELIPDNKAALEMGRRELETMRGASSTLENDPLRMFDHSRYSLPDIMDRVDSAVRDEAKANEHLQNFGK